MPNKSELKAAANISLLKKHYFFWGWLPENVVLVIFYQQLLDSYALVGLIFMLMRLFIALFTIPAGILSDYMGRKNTLIISAAFYCLTKACYLAALFFMPFEMLLLSSLFYGLAESFILSTNQSLLYETLKMQKREDEFHKVYGRTKAFHNAGLAASGLAGGLTASVLSFKYVMIMALAGSMVFLAISMKLYNVAGYKKEKNKFGHLKKALRDLVSNPRLSWLLAAESTDAGGSRAMGEYMPLYIQTIIPYWAMGAMKSLGQAACVTALWLSGNLAAVFGKIRVFKFFISLAPVSAALALMANGIATPFLLLAGDFGAGVTHPISAEIRQKEYAERRRATMGSLFIIINNLAEGAGSLLIGLLAAVVTPYYALIAFLGLRFVAIPIFFRAVSVQNPQTNPD